MPTPNVIIAGAPKCGTTSLFDWLADHPEVGTSSVKETRYFYDRGYPRFNKRSNYDRQGLKGYLAYFTRCEGKNLKVILEATPHYIYQRTALEVLPRLHPCPKIMFILRKPSDRVYSLYQFALNNMAVLDKPLSFADFVSMVRSGSAELPEERVIPRRALEHSKYVNYISQWLEKFGREKICVLLFESLREDPLAFMEQVSRCIGIDRSFWQGYAFPRRNESFRVRNQTVQRLVLRVASFVPRSIRYSPLRDLYRRLLTQPLLPKSGDDCEVLDALEKEFEPYNEALAELLEIDLSAWK